ncbi:CapA family protein [Actinopolymorpha alba]|uniref:CapA family protein n=1 Tax=Actinopolymorpha alba TaxID=533267 RepID=UPI00037B85CD|nr:CapA family protein [Actinopolymorpha alba]
MAVTLGLAGDTMLGREVAEHLRAKGPHSVFDPGVRDVAAEADVVVLNLECCLSDRGTQWPAPGKPFFFRAPPIAAETLAWLGVDCVTLANNHALDFSEQALLDTVSLLSKAGIACVGAGSDVHAARRPAVLTARGTRLGIVGVTDHPLDFAAGEGRPGVAYADLRDGVPPWLVALVRDQRAEVDELLVTPHWGPNMTSAPLPYLRSAASVLLAAGATLIAGHSAHVFHGVADSVIFDLGDFVDDYRVDPYLRNDLGIFVLLTLDGPRPRVLRVVPLALEYCFTRLARPSEYTWVRDRFVAACQALDPDLEVSDEGDHLRVEVPRPGPVAGAA